MAQIFSPKQVAGAIGVSESSVKRWCDQGILPTVKTAGGHRRVPMSGVVEFVRQRQLGIPHPEMLGLPVRSSGPLNSTESTTLLYGGLKDGDYRACRDWVLQAVLSGYSLAEILDEGVRDCLVRLGESWSRGELEVYRERRSCENLIRLVHELRETAEIQVDGPSAIGGTLPQDPYTLSTKMAELVLAELGWNANALGCGIPIESMIDAIRQQRPRLFWLALSVPISPEDPLVEDLLRLYAACGPSTALVVGGRGFSEPLRSRIKYTAFCESFQRLRDFAQVIYRRPSTVKS